MSRKQLRLAQAQQEVPAAPSESSEGEGEEEEVPGRVVNKFDLLCGDDAEDDAEENSSSEASAEEAPAPVQIVSSNKGKKRRNKRNKKKASSSPENFSDLEELIEQNLSVSSANGAEATLEAFCPLAHPLSTDVSLIDEEKELQRTFGVAPDRPNPRRGGRAGAGLRSLAGKPRFPARLAMGVAVEKDGEHAMCGTHDMVHGLPEGSTEVVGFHYDKHYMKRQREFEELFEIQDHQGIMDSLQRGGTIASQLHCAGLLRHNEDVSVANDIVCATIHCLEEALGSRRNHFWAVDYAREENRGLFVSLFQRMMSLNEARCPRSALEIAKVLLRLSVTGDDPLAAMLMVDTLAINSEQYAWFTYFVSHYDKLPHNLRRLPNIAFSEALACFNLSRGEGSVTCHKQLKEAIKTSSLSKEGFKTQADDLLKDAIKRFPSWLRRLKGEAVDDQGGWEGVLLDLYWGRLGPRWQEPEVREWLNLVSAASPQPQLVAKSRLAPPVPILRHVLLCQREEFFQPLGVSQLAQMTAHYDPLPPLTHTRTHTEDSAATHTAATSTSVLYHFLASLNPEFREGDAPQGVLGALEGAFGALWGAFGGAAGGEERRGEDEPPGQ